MTSSRPFKARVIAAVAATFLVSLAGTAYADAVSGQGTWETTLQARYFTDDYSHGPDAYYDTDLNVTWLADANSLALLHAIYFPYDGFDFGKGYYSETNTLFSHFEPGGISGWRLPQVNNIGWDSCGGNPTCGENPSVKSSELAHLFYVTLGDKANTNPVTGQSNQPGYGLVNTGPFINFQSGRYLEVMPRQVYLSIWSFDTSIGYQSDNSYGYAGYMFAVHDGDVGSPVPEPSSTILLTMGLAGLLIARRRTQG